MRPLLLVVVVFSVMLAGTLTLNFENSWAQDEDEAAMQQLERQAELAKKELELQRELEHEAREDDDDNEGLNLSFGTLNMANMALVGTVAAVIGVTGYAGYKLVSIRRKAALARKKSPSSA